MLGAGVSGLTTALLLQEEGFAVSIITNELPGQTTSAKAAAIWFPYEAYPMDKVNRWSNRSYYKFRDLVDDTASGVSMVPFTVYLDTTKDPWWLDAIPPEAILQDYIESPADPSHRGIKIQVPLIESPIYLPYLMSRFKANGGSFEQKTLHSLGELDSSSLTINCTGLGAAQLCEDEALYPMQGQVIKLEPMDEVHGMATEYPMGKNGDEMAYIIPRRDGIILGGSAKNHQTSLTPDHQLTFRILGYCKEFDPRISEQGIKEVRVGLRPGRSSIRLEKQANASIIHNYGHGGAGYTVSWGCAQEVLQLAQAHRF